MTGPAADATPGAQERPAAAAPAEAERKRLSSHQLFGTAREVEITHGDAVYRLRRTALGKLILTK